MELNFVELATGTPTPTIEQAVDALLKLRANKTKLEKRLKVLKTGEEALEKYLLGALAEHKLDKTTVHGVTIAPLARIVPHAVDWEQIHAWVRETGDLSILHRRLSAERLRELAEDDNLPPGVKMVELIELSVRAVRKKFNEEELV